MSTLGSLSIASIAVAKKTNNQPLPAGNQIADLRTYTKTDGSTGTVGEVQRLADVNLAVDTFYRQFPDSVALAAGVTALPNMRGSGLVRDLWEAMSQSAELEALVSPFAAATTRAAQMAIMDQILTAWADTSGLKATLEARLPTRSDTPDAPARKAHGTDVLREHGARRAISCGAWRGSLHRSPLNGGGARIDGEKRRQRQNYSNCPGRQLNRGSLALGSTGSRKAGPA